MCNRALHLHRNDIKIDFEINLHATVLEVVHNGWMNNKYPDPGFDVPLKTAPPMGTGVAGKWVLFSGNYLTQGIVFGGYWDILHFFIG